jgi:ABC-type transporter lipoprotein component MlaA
MDRCLPALGYLTARESGKEIMSEYQYYEFLAVDHPLDERQQAEVRALSSRARITATSFTNE